jgi:hypothetical protein
MTTHDLLECLGLGLLQGWGDKHVLGEGAYDEAWLRVMLVRDDLGMAQGGCHGMA